ncbi:solute carrier family 35 member F1-like [Hordeum vulgare]|uniref:Solute carrier family 35 member F1 n=1 Tax=Hordeum vulgare subsp. vulgare TaxID=112509 RepID=A0A8I6ZA02_HORVV|nr:solute carrier family 35 member F1-like [Hordeum vulgare subsp. vulgare]KAE8806915.1 solute carrier family 35 member F1-like [Hordeum vulgare]
MAPPPEGDGEGGGGCARWLRREVLLALALGQLVSLLITSTGFSSSELARRGINAPTSQSLLNYILLALVYGGILLYRRQPLTTKWYYYLILGIIDVEANYIVVKSYQYTSLTSVMLLDCWSIPCVIVLTWIFLKTKYGFRKFFGVGVCVAGLILVVFSDVHASDRAKGPKPLKGDLLVIVGSMLYACSNVTEEYLVKKNNRIELMAMLGIFGAVISGIQISVLEREELHSIKWNAGAVFPFIGFALAMFLFYSTVPTVLKICGATMLNLSLLTSDMWAVLIRIFAYHEKVDWMYFVAFACTAGGLLVYSYRSSKEADDTAQVAGASDEQSRVGDEESGIQNQVRSSFAGGNDDQASYKELPSKGSPSKN